MFIKPKEIVIHVNIVGDVNAPVVVLLHSLDTNLHIWDEQVNVLKENYRVLSIDMRGHGLSELSGEPFTIEDLANDVLSVIDYFNIKTFSVAGVSIGGLVAQHLADNVPGILNSVILVDTYLAPALSSDASLHSACLHRLSPASGRAWLNNFSIPIACVASTVHF